MQAQLIHSQIFQAAINQENGNLPRQYELLVDKSKEEDEARSNKLMTQLEEVRPTHNEAGKEVLENRQDANYLSDRGKRKWTPTEEEYLLNENRRSQRDVDRGRASRPETEVRVESERWEHLREECIKINTDAGINLQNNRVGLAAVGRDSNDNLVKVRAVVLQKQGFAFIEEAIAIRNALIMARNKGGKRMS
ncbi:hypothetical protein ACH5RR_008611 [Cinchona calisaya]|uniref:RNase H type-1 domain-containing protein n=1 Tax=Cinchona calisaya TaxID=153742 RepID=A0ABD3AC28_9GENT